MLYITVSGVCEDSSFLRKVNLPNHVPVSLDGFEKATFPDDPEWMTEGISPWALSTENAFTGKYSIKSPVLANDDGVQAQAEAIFITDPSWDSGTLSFQVLAGSEMPYDTFEYFVDGAKRGELNRKTEWEMVEVTMSPGGHIVTFRYTFNPVPLSMLPPLSTLSDNYIGSVWIDDVAFYPAGVTVPTIPGEIVVPDSTPAPVSQTPTSFSALLSRSFCPRHEDPRAHRPNDHANDHPHRDRRAARGGGVDAFPSACIGPARRCVLRRLRVCDVPSRS